MIWAAVVPCLWNRTVQKSFANTRKRWGRREISWKTNVSCNSGITRNLNCSLQFESAFGSQQTLFVVSIVFWTWNSYARWIERLPCALCKIFQTFCGSDPTFFVCHPRGFRSKSWALISKGDCFLFIQKCWLKVAACQLLLVPSLHGKNVSVERVLRRMVNFSGHIRSFKRDLPQPFGKWFRTWKGARLRRLIEMFRAN